MPPKSNPSIPLLSEMKVLSMLFVDENTNDACGGGGGGW